MISLELIRVIFQDETLMDYAEVIEFEKPEGADFYRILLHVTSSSD